MTGMAANAMLFGIGTAAIAWFSRKPLRCPGSHGFYRFFAWEGILALWVMNRNAWGMDPYSIHQLIAWPLLIVSFALVMLGVLALVRHGDITGQREGATLYDWEKTTTLVTTGVFAHIRHPMYASLLALAWAALLEAPSWPGAAIAATVTVLLLVTTFAEERECLDYFGNAYAEYMRRTWRFVPGVF